MDIAEWLVPAEHTLPDWFIQEVRRYADGSDSHYAARLLWQRGIQTLQALPGFLKPDQYQPSSPFEFGQEMDWAIARLLQAQQQSEKVLIWGDFDADGITATALLWDGLGQFFSQSDHLSYYIPDRLTDSHGLSIAKIDQFASERYQLIVTCDNGSTNLAELIYAQQLQVDVIVTDHHTLPLTRPPVTAIINPRSLPDEHPMHSLSGVAVAYKLVEALYQRSSLVPQQPLEALLDLVAIGLIADLVSLTGESRYLAQRGLAMLQTLSPVDKKSLAESRRPGITRLLELCKRAGDRPSDVAFGLGPRINAVSRIQGEAHFCVELLTSQDVSHCQHLAEQTELANTRRKALQRDLVRQVRQRLQTVDLSTTNVIVLADPQWSVGIVGLVAGQIAQEYGRPTILLQTGLPETSLSNNEMVFSREADPVSPIARGSARSVNQIDLYQLIQDQAHLLHRFGGHPFALGLSLPIDNLPLFTSALDRRLKQLHTDLVSTETVGQVDLVVTVAALGKTLFRELKLLEPFGMGNPVPKLLVRNAWFERPWNQNIKDWKGNRVQYIKTEFEIWDESCDRGFPGIWWEHYADELPTDRCDAIVELEFDAYKRDYKVHLIALRNAVAEPPSEHNDRRSPSPRLKTPHPILDWRDRPAAHAQDQELSLHSQPQHPFTAAPTPEQLLVMTDCPRSWAEMKTWLQQATQAEKILALAYQPPDKADSKPMQIWQQLVGVAKFLSRTGNHVDRHQICQRLTIADTTLALGLDLLPSLGFQVISQGNTVQILPPSTPSLQHETQRLKNFSANWDAFVQAIQEEQFRQQYFTKVPLPVIQTIATPH